MRLALPMTLLPHALAAAVLVAGCGAPMASPSYAGPPGGGRDPDPGTGTGVVAPCVVAHSGSVPPAVEDALRRQHGLLRSCWDRLTLEHPEVSDGQALVRFELDPSGRVRSVELLSGPVEDPSFRTCVEERARGMSFPQGDASSVFSHSFAFGVSAGTGVE
ncbi:MAG: AgmX/PglI C-terminal domain-containing protein [Deltaproteobacteria bacterium]|nr:AgmX/PglI C-terminal domain-containing protein [Deltaproteobacteria bacterium]